MPTLSMCPPLPKQDDAPPPDQGYAQLSLCPFPTRGYTYFSCLLPEQDVVYMTYCLLPKQDPDLIHVLAIA
jgi:hypothetical protein